MCSHLFWCVNKEYKNGQRVLECLQKSLKTAGDLSMNVHLFVEILNEYLYYFENRNEAVAVKYVSGLVELIQTEIGNMDSSNETSETRAIIAHYQNTLDFIKWKKNIDERYKQIQI